MHLFKFKLVDLHNSKYIKNEVHWRPVDEIGEYLHFSVIDGGNTGFYREA